jgi:hypothetical protein
MKSVCSENAAPFDIFTHAAPFIDVALFSRSASQPCYECLEYQNNLNSLKKIHVGGKN